MDDHQFKEGENESVGEVSKVCAQIVFEMPVFTFIGRPDLCGNEMDKSMWLTFGTFDL